MLNILVNTNKVEDLKAEKKKDFKKVVILQCLIIFSALLLKDILSMLGITNTYEFRDVLFMIFGGIYVYVLWDMLSNFTSNKLIIYTLFTLIIGTFLLATVTVIPFISIFDSDQERQPYLFFIHSVLFSVEATVIYFAIKDIFSGNKLSEEKLWGSACIYLMIAISFGSVYDLINIAMPGSMGVPLNMGLDSYLSCITYSLTILGGQDPPYANAIPLISRLGIIESVWANLFIVLLVGRLLGQPDENGK